MKEEWLKKLSGCIEADYSTTNYSYSSWTSGTDYDAILKIGTHDFFTELKSYKDKFVLIEIHFK